MRGTAELVEDLDLKKEIVQKRPFLKPFVEQGGYEQMAVYRVKNGKATVWTMKNKFGGEGVRGAVDEHDPAGRLTHCQRPIEI